MMRALLERVAPARIGSLVAFFSGPIRTAADAVAANGRLLEALARGNVTTAEAAQIATVIENHRRLLETAEIERRLDEIEEIVNAAD